MIPPPNAPRLAATMLVGLLTLLCLPGAAAAERLSELFDTGNGHAFEGEYRQAIDAYDALVEAGVEDPDVYYNLGSAHAGLGQLGYAVLYLERAARLAGGDDEVQRALSSVREALGKRAAERDGEALVRTRPPLLDALVEPLPESALAAVLQLWTWLLFLGLLARRLPALAHLRLALGVTAALAGCLAVLTGGALAIRSDALQDGQRAVVVAQDGALLEGPDANAKARGTLVEGGLARLVAREGQWVRLRTDQGLDGWAPADAVGLVRIGN